jgi:hypothetical protein
MRWYVCITAERMEWGEERRESASQNTKQKIVVIIVE